MEDKRRRARVQGAWAGPTRRIPQAAPPARPYQWCKEQPSQEKQFVYKEPTEVARRVPEPRLIDVAGVHELSVSPAGVSRVHLFPLFIDSSEADWMFEQLLQEVSWGQKTNMGPDGPYQEPRLTSWYGEVAYTYSRSTIQPNPHWHPLLTMLKDRIEEVTGYTFNALFCNLYRHDKDSIDWHSDDEPALGRNPVIASLSLGDTRIFQMRRKPSPEDGGDYTYVERVHVPLAHGTLLLMEGATQEDWQHRVPKEYHDRKPRINLTFRTMFPETEGQHQ
ncbi:alpha-ketoglutarate-dependent dioxygenase alkB homolog 3 isoform X2 [Bombina bombina]|uniref:alpha-ketoglutarate-dependent dioxygenase alkB homolog 3 isoform X2 n=1 Tax=Bombina bombina TaxID=8345 RepID=UPI00235AB7E3|nr:alpha-ketoglutarate-dependent dioxygenase alkB homolog 3 isoform X2 [Bombina bombina]XP_053576204.1 alpha-ketoglutarate-dependent dioxygenase alkB homolog 3 isoform X2 [Bombina bombina]XP_053576205.1 alpha-ketoglutarate-dependent dioxygenase alkB homolog 3 isoform X2 [Bombina bombina]XP_053576206.1 alpha-ketoglutarate-dependent dioxygenase alkB homolog 3 isoform X2 [Bombina bombina]